MCIKYVCSECAVLKDLTVTEAAYLAGLIDGEGCITIVREKSNHYRCVIQIVLTSSILIDLCNEYGGNWCLGKSRNLNWKPCYRWFWTLDLQVKYLPLILPYLKIKKEQGQILLACLSSRFKYSRQHKAKFADALKRLRFLNRRGRFNAS